MNTVTKMRLSKETLNILKNFSAINSNILIKPGNILRTKSASNNIYAEAKISEEFETEVPIWDLNKFLGVISMFVNPDLEFNDTHVDISNGKSFVRYHYSEPSLLTVAKKGMDIPESIISFDLSEANLNEILKASSILQVSDLKIIAKDGNLKIYVDDQNDDTSNSFSLIVNENYSGPDYEGNFNVSAIKFYPGSYRVNLTKNVITQFVHESGLLSYCIATKRD